MAEFFARAFTGFFPAREHCLIESPEFHTMRKGKNYSGLDIFQDGYYRLWLWLEKNGVFPRITDFELHFEPQRTPKDE